MRSILLTLHILAVVVWLGAGLYDLFLIREMRRSAGDAVELALIRIRLRYGPVIAVATFVVLFTGVLMSSLLGWSYTSRIYGSGSSNSS
jgi:putative copper export protein